MAPSGSRFRLQAVIPVKLDTVWHLVEDNILKWLGESLGEYALTDVYDAVKRGDMHLWRVFVGEEEKAVVITAIIEHPKIKTINICGVGGSGFEQWWKGVVEEIGLFGKELGCGKLIIAGRDGWKKVLKSGGFRVNYSLMVKDL